VQRYINVGGKLDVVGFIKFDSIQFSWDAHNKLDLEKSRKYKYDLDSFRTALYRPFSKTNCYFNKHLINRRFQMMQIYPDTKLDNQVICLTVTGEKEFSVLMANILPDLHLICDAQCFPPQAIRKKLTRG